MSFNQDNEPPYQVVLRYKSDGHDSFAWFEYGGRLLTAVTAQKLIDGMTPYYPALSKPDCPFHLVAEPIGAVR